MSLKVNRLIAFLLILATCASMLALPVMAASDGTQQTDSMEEILAAEPVEEVETVVPTVNVIENDNSGEPAADEPVQTPADETQEPAESVEPAETPVAGEPAKTQAEEASEEGLASGDPAQTDGTASYTVTYYSGTTKISQETVAQGESPAAAPAEDASNAKITGWLNASGSFVVVTKAVITADTAYYAWYAPALQTAEHNRYINGMGNGKFGPTNSLTRAQAATLLYNLMISKSMGSYSSSFSDVSSSDWYYTAVTTLASHNVLSGYTDGTFRPNNSISRAEFVTMLVRLFGLQDETQSFSDVPATHWAVDYIATAAANGWVTGYTDGTFRPSQSITRAEAVVVINRVLGRVPDKTTITNGENILHYLDVTSNYWWYWDVMEASIGHAYTRTSSGETWTDYTVESCGLTAGLWKIDGKLYCVKSATLQFAKLVSGVNHIDNCYYYASEAGYVIDSDVTSLMQGLEGEDPEPGFNLVNGTLFYWDEAKNAPRAVTAGLNEIDGKMYYADADGYIIRNDFGAGVVNLNGKLYISDGACAIVTTYYDYTGSSPVEKDLKNSTYEYNNNMYYVQSDYSLLTNAWQGYLYFGADGKYTSGDSTLDAYVYNILSSNQIITNNKLTQHDKLLKAYYYLRGGNGAQSGSTPYSYRQYDFGCGQARYNGQVQYSWQISCAKHFFSNKNGECYHWASSYLFLARRLGFQAYTVVGKVGGNQAVHCWCMIYWDGTWHLSDVELEWGYITGWYTGTKYYWNLFDQALATEYMSHYTNPECGLTYYFP